MRFGESMSEVVLLVACEGDEASTCMAQALLGRQEFEPSRPVEGAPSFAKGRVRLWFRPGFHLDQDDLDERWQTSTGERVQDVLFLSKHAAASGRPCLTVHPVGVPHLAPDETPPYGGRSGTAPPPSPRLAKIWRGLLHHADDPRIPEFEVSLEVTHHGPSQKAPAAFLEVGSSAATWGHEGAADVWADVILALLKEELKGGSAAPESSQVPVLVTFGGGHYAPRANQMGALEGALLGHMLANHSLPFKRDEDGTVFGSWSQAVDVALDASRAAHPTRDLVVSLDRKSFRGWERSALFDHLENRNVRVIDTATHRTMLDGS